MIFKFVLCDDNPSVLKDVEEFIRHYYVTKDLECMFTKFSDYDKNFDMFVKNNNDKVIYMLDIDTLPTSGLMAAKRIRKHDKKSIIIFSSYNRDLERYVIEERLNALTFIPKINYREYLEKTLDEIINYNVSIPYLNICEGSIKYRIKFSDILYIIKEQRKTKIVTDKKNYYIYCNLCDIHKSLDCNFAFCHRSCLINKTRIEALDQSNKIVVFDNGVYLDVISNKYVKNLI